MVFDTKKDELLVFERSPPFGALRQIWARGTRSLSADRGRRRPRAGSEDSCVSTASQSASNRWERFHHAQRRAAAAETAASSAGATPRRRNPLVLYKTLKILNEIGFVFSSAYAGYFQKF